MSGRGTQGRGRPPVADRGRGSRASSRADSSSSASVSAALPAADIVSFLPVLSKHLGFGAGLCAPPTPLVVPPPVAAAVPAPTGIDYQQIEALVQRVMQQQQQQVLPPGGVDAVGIQPVVEAAEPVLPGA